MIRFIFVSNNQKELSALLFTTLQRPEFFTHMNQIYLSLL